MKHDFRILRKENGPSSMLKIVVQIAICAMSSGSHLFQHLLVSLLLKPDCLESLVKNGGNVEKCLYVFTEDVGTSCIQTCDELTID